MKKLYEITSEDEKKLSKLSDYQQAILRLLAEVPRGKITTYGDLSKELARRNPKWSPNAGRAVGTTMNKNPCGPQIPCHRVIRSDGKMGGFSAFGGTDLKKRLLNHEKHLL